MAEMMFDYVFASPWLHMMMLALLIFSYIWHFRIRRNAIDLYREHEYLKRSHADFKHETKKILSSMEESQARTEASLQLIITILTKHEQK